MKVEKIPYIFNFFKLFSEIQLFSKKFNFFKNRILLLISTLSYLKVEYFFKNIFKNIIIVIY